LRFFRCQDVAIGAPRSRTFERIDYLIVPGGLAYMWPRRSPIRHRRLDARREGDAQPRSGGNADSDNAFT
jgi:hypothetical protein